MIGEFFGGFLCDRIGWEKSMTLSLVMFGASIVWLNLAGAVSSPALVFVFTLFYGIGQCMAAPALMISASDLFQGKHFGMPGAPRSGFRNAPTGSVPRAIASGR